MSGIVAVGIPSRFGLTGTKTAYKDENILLGEAQALNFVGDGVTATLDAGVLTIDVPNSGGSSVTVVDNLLSTSATDALSANQGRALSETIANLTANDVGADESGAADTAEQNAKDYADGLVTGLWKDQGNFDASGGSWPTSANTIALDAVKVGYLWKVSVAGVLTGGIVLSVGDIIRALVDDAGDTAVDWAANESNIGYVPENQANKATNLTSPNNTDYPTTQAVVTALADYQEALPAPTGATKFLREDLTWQELSQGFDRQNLANYSYILQDFVGDFNNSGGYSVTTTGFSTSNRYQCSELGMENALGVLRCDKIDAFASSVLTVRSMSYIASTPPQSYKLANLTLDTSIAFSTNKWLNGNNTGGIALGFGSPSGTAPYYKPSTGDYVWASLTVSGLYIESKSSGVTTTDNVAIPYSSIIDKRNVLRLVVSSAGATAYLDNDNGANLYSVSIATNIPTYVGENHFTWRPFASEQAVLSVDFIDLLVTTNTPRSV